MSCKVAQTAVVWGSGGGSLLSFKVAHTAVVGFRGVRRLFIFM